MRGIAVFTTVHRIVSRNRPGRFTVAEGAERYAQVKREDVIVVVVIGIVIVTAIDVFRVGIVQRVRHRSKRAAEAQVHGVRMFTVPVRGVVHAQ
ncbi:Uncharacterised protein [Enterobacter cloacae]|nr:Uncharacterised protein [Enterobacter cloacae]